MQSLVHDQAQPIEVVNRSEDDEMDKSDDERRNNTEDGDIQDEDEGWSDEDEISCRMDQSKQEIKDTLS